MSISTLHRLDKITGPLALSELTQMKWSAGIKSMVEYPSGHTHPFFRANQDQQPELGFTCCELSTLLTAVTLEGLQITSASPLVSYFKKATATGNVARATTSHRKLSINSGVLYWSSISLPHNGRAEAQCLLAINYDGTNAPIVYAGSQALSGNLSGVEYFTCGPVRINGAALPGVKSITIDSGITCDRESGDGEVFPTFVGISRAACTVTVKLLEMVNWSTIGLEGTALDGSAGLVFYARKYSSTARVANGTAQHVMFQGLNGSAIPIDTDGQDASPLSDTIKFELIAASDSVLPLVITTSSTIA